MTSVKTVIFSEPYNQLVDEIIRRTGMRIYPDYNENLQRIDEIKISKANIAEEELLALLTLKRDRILSYSLSKFRILDNLQEIEEFPKGEEPEEYYENNNQVDEGYSRGFLLVNLMEYLSIQKGGNALEKYLKVMRIPQMKGYARTLQEIVLAMETPMETP